MWQSPCHHALDTSVEEHHEMNRAYIQHSVEALAITSMTLEDGNSFTQKATSILHEIEEGEVTIQQLALELSETKNSIRMLHSNIIELEEKKADLLNKIQQLHNKTDNEGSGETIQRLISVLELLKVLQKQESDFQSYCKQKRADMQAEMAELEKDVLISSQSKAAADFELSLSDSLENLNSAKKELAAKQREILSLKRRFDDVPVQTELIQYERRFSELYVQIQEKLRQTRKHYATYNALLEIKELMLKETSLLNSISSQFQEAITSTTGRSKLIDSMEVIVKGTQQKLKKVQLSLATEQKICDSLKEKYSTAVAEQRRFSSLLKAFQEECAKNERLQSLNSI